MTPNIGRAQSSETNVYCNIKITNLLKKKNSNHLSTVSPAAFFRVSRRSRSYSLLQTAAILVSHGERNLGRVPVLPWGEVDGRGFDATPSPFSRFGALSRRTHGKIGNCKECNLPVEYRCSYFFFLLLTNEFSRYFLVLSGLLWVTTQVHNCFADAAHF